MTAVSPVLPSLDPGSYPEKVIGKDQAEYENLPSVLSADLNRVTNRWRLTWKERFAVLLSGDLWTQQLLFGHQVQPMKVMAEEPTAEDCL